MGNLKPGTKGAVTKRVAPVVFSAPVGGINYAVPAFNMPEPYCRRIMNGLVSGGGIISRKPIPSAVDATTMPASGTNYGHNLYLMHYVSGTTEALLIQSTRGFVNRYNSLNNITNIVNPGGTGSGVTDCVSFNFNGFLVYTRYPNFAPRTYNGADALLAITRPATGAWSTLADSDITGGHPFKNRVYYWSRKCAEFMYTALNAIGGVCVAFPLSRISQTGGNVLMITSLTMDGGAGPDDFLVIILDTGECVLYQGSDPSSADDWSIVGRYQINPPVNASACCRMGGDVLLLTKMGLIPIQQYIKASFGKIDAPWLDAINPRIRSYCTNNDNNDGRGLGQITYLTSIRKLCVMLNNGSFGAFNGILTLPEGGGMLVFDVDGTMWTEFGIPGTININGTTQDAALGEYYVFLNAIDYAGQAFFGVAPTTNNPSPGGSQSRLMFYNASATNIGAANFPYDENTTGSLVGVPLVEILWGYRLVDDTFMLEAAEIFGATNGTQVIGAVEFRVAKDFGILNDIGSNSAFQWQDNASLFGTPQTTFPTAPIAANFQGSILQPYWRFCVATGTPNTLDQAVFYAVRFQCTQTTFLA